MTHRRYKSTEIQKRLHVPKSVLNNWLNAGIVVPFEDAKGRGKSRDFSFQNLLEILICRELWLLELPPRVYGYILADIPWEEVLKDDPEPWFLIIYQPARQVEGATGSYTKQVLFVPRVFKCEKPEDLGSVVWKARSPIIVNLKSLVAEAKGI